MFIRSVCPRCDSTHTERVFVDWWTESVNETRVCNECGTQYTIRYGNPDISVDRVSDR